jgi:hypothetical protein
VPKRSALAPLEIVILLCVLGSSCRRPAASPGGGFVVSGTDAAGAVIPYAAVHVDHLQVGALTQFAEARRRWLRVLAQQSTTDGRGLFLQTADSGFLSIRPLRSLGDLDRQPALSAAALVSVDPAELRRYDDASDALLAPPHRNEIWKYDPDLSFGVNDPIAALGAAAWGKMTVEEIDPTPAGQDYARVWREERTLLVGAEYPLVRVSYWSRYGTGDLVTFWLSKSQMEFLRTKSVEATVEGALGHDVAEALFARQRKVVLASDSVDVIPRLDLSSRPL